MAVSLRRILGPFRRTTGKHEIKWHFIAIRADHTTAHYVLVYEIGDRSWRAHSKSGSLTKKPAHPELTGMFLNDVDHVVTGRLVDLLKARIVREDIALAAELSMKDRLT